MPPPIPELSAPPIYIILENSELCPLPSFPKFLNLVEHISLII